jgi:hypothetical protein
MHEQKLCSTAQGDAGAHAPCTRRNLVWPISRKHSCNAGAQNKEQLCSTTHKHGPGSYRQPRSAKAITCSSTSKPGSIGKATLNPERRCARTSTGDCCVSSAVSAREPYVSVSVHAR